MSDDEVNEILEAEVRRMQLSNAEKGYRGERQERAQIVTTTDVFGPTPFVPMSGEGITPRQHSEPMFESEAAPPSCASEVSIGIGEGFERCTGCISRLDNANSYQSVEMDFTINPFNASVGFGGFEAGNYSGDVSDNGTCADPAFFTQGTLTGTVSCANGIYTVQIRSLIGPGSVFTGSGPKDTPINNLNTCDGHTDFINGTVTVTEL